MEVLKIDLLNLNDLEVATLLKSLKQCQSMISNKTSLFGKIKDDTPVKDENKNVEYKLHRYRSSTDNKRFSLHIRFKSTNDILIRVDIRNGTHRNPDGQIIGQNHMHIYKTVKNSEKKDAIAVDLPDDINDLSSLFTVLQQFLQYTNTKEK